MRIRLFVHSLVSCWNHGNVHFIRGLMRALASRGHDVLAVERWRSWSVDGLYEQEGHGPILDFARTFPDLPVRTYRGGRDILDEVDVLTRGADLVLVHEFNDPELVGAAAHVRSRRKDFLLLFHDTHHRAVSAPHEILRLNLEAYDGVLAFGRSLADVYRHVLGKDRVWTLHEAADTSLFKPSGAEKEDDVVWIGNWGDGERSRELSEYLVAAARALPRLSFAVHGVRYPESAVAALAKAGIRHRGWIPNHRVPNAFARARLTLHIPRGPYLDRLPGIPTIRPFEALACGIPLLSTPWPDVESLFRQGHDYVRVTSAEDMRRWIRRLTEDPEEAERLSRNGVETILARHTCHHRAEELEAIVEELSGDGGAARRSPVRRRARKPATTRIVPPGTG